MNYKTGSYFEDLNYHSQYELASINKDIMDKIISQINSVNSNIFGTYQNRIVKYQLSPLPTTPLLNVKKKCVPVNTYSDLTAQISFLMVNSL